MESGSSRNARLFWPLAATVVALDAITKWLAVRALVPMYTPREVMGDLFRFTLVYNKGAAFGLHVGPYSRWVFLILTLVALVVLGRLYRTTRAGDQLRTLALALVCGGAIGNLIDRVRHDSGVVDFLDLGIGDWRWPTFNIADVAVSVGAFLLAWALWGEEESEEPQLAAAPGPVPTMNPGHGD
ncbi:MAG TPA: signal peptidase II [Gemmatimonadaceae bacterium]|nr:signal peptidase II [Gemmatimonadaceae bacterium]